ncbi:type VI secretion protein [Streptomyces venezuelae]|uniref:Type VI secretion protein n=1 Tax=Streptomyces venezuelae TaxID=54571 RepID=A0A5P2CUV9_STRVZ|nr:type IV secretory system conjugative DNA transfer family protein [Streptomyces venezuelae]QES46040.1 type VI secretion protein [Streptomyces venezuelae]
MPDGLLVGFLGFLIGATVLVWSATNLAGRFARGAWPEKVSFGHTPPAVRHLIGNPKDVAGAWPETPADQLSGYGLFWGLFIGQLMVLIVMTVFVMGTVTRWRAVRRARREGAEPTGSATAPAEGAGGGGSMGPVTASAAGEAAAPGEAATPTPGPGPGLGPVPEPGSGLGPGSGSVPGPGSGSVPGLGPGPGPGPTSVPTPGPPPAVPGVPAPPFPSPTHSPTPFPATTPVEHVTPVAAAPASDTPPAAVPPTVPTVPTPRSPLVLGGPATRRPLAVQAVQDAEGAALVLTSDPTLWAETKDARAKLGPVLLYDPSHLCDTPARLHWSPTRGCADKATADTRAAALLAPTRPASKLDVAVADTAQLLMRSFLHAAAVADKPMKIVHRWSQGNQVQEAVRILRTHPKAASGSAGELEAALTAHPERRDMAQELTARSLAALFTVHVRESCTPNRTDALSLDSFVDEGGTLFVVGEAIEDPKSRQGPGAMPLLTALASSVVEHGRRMAARSSSGRLDPPMTLVLDDVAAVAPLPQLPELLSTGADRGLPTLALLRSREQGRSRWPDSELPVT